MAARHSARLCAFSTALQDRDLPAALRFCAEQGIGALELGVGGWPSTAHADAEQLARDPAAVRALRADSQAAGVRLAALSCHGNPLHPDTARAARDGRQLRAALESAHALEVPVVVAFSGQPGPGVPNWPVVAWPDDYAALWERQWQDALIPYWLGLAQRASELGVVIALELHGGFAVHSPSTLLRLRAACGPAIAANLDPSHLWWQGIDPLAAVQLLGPAVAHFHVKDLLVNPARLAEHGWLDHTPFAQRDQRAWQFVKPGDGHDASAWRTLLDGLLAQGYAGVFSIEHEGVEAPAQGLALAADFIAQL